MTKLEMRKWIILKLNDNGSFFFAGKTKELQCRDTVNTNVKSNLLTLFLDAPEDQIFTCLEDQMGNLHFSKNQYIIIK